MQKIGTDNIYVIAEIGLNYDGDFDQAIEMVQRSKQAGAHAVKFQTFQASQLVNPYTLDQEGKLQKFTFYEDLKKLELKEEEHAQLASLCKNLNIDFISSPFDVLSLEIVAKHCQAIKIASSELTNYPLLEKCGQYHKPVFISMGMGSMNELKKAIEILQQSGVNEIYPLYCVSLYPLDYLDANLKVIQQIQIETGLITGFSDHSLGDELSLAAVTMGARIIEKHVTLKREDRLYDHGFSMEFEELAQLIVRSQNIIHALGTGVQKLGNKEEKVKSLARRSFFALKDIQKGETLKIGENIHAVRPVIGVPLEEGELIDNAQAKKDIKAYFPIFFDDIVK